MEIIEQAGKYRAVANGVGGFAFEVQDGGRWHRFGSETGDRRNASIKIARLAGMRDTHQSQDEWAAFYRVNV